MISNFTAVLLVGYGVLMCKIFGGVVCDCNSGCDGDGDGNADVSSDDVLHQLL